MEWGTKLFLALSLGILQSPWRSKFLPGHVQSRMQSFCPFALPPYEWFLSEAFSQFIKGKIEWGLQSAESQKFTQGNTVLCLLNWGQTDWKQNKSTAFSEVPWKNCTAQNPLNLSTVLGRIYTSKTRLPACPGTYIYVRVIHRIFLLLLLAGGIPLCTSQKVRYLLC